MGGVTMLAKTNKTMWHILWVGTLFFFIGFVFAAPCSAQKAPKGKATVVFAENLVMNGGDCHTAKGSGAMNIAFLIHEGLVGRDHDGRLVPALAKSWEVSKDGLRIKFTLNERAKFHNGEPVTAKDVKFSIERAMRPELKYRGGPGLMRSIDRIEVMDDHHLTVYFKSPCPAFFDFSTQHLGIVPKAYVEKVGDEEFAKHPIGAGPFRWIDYQQDVFVNVEAVEDHYRRVPRVKTLHCKSVLEEATIMAMFKAGEADIVQIPFTTYPEVKDDPKIGIVWSKFVCGCTLTFYDLAFPNEQSPFHDVRVRRAASYAIDRKAISEKLLHGAAEPWGDILAPYHPGVDPNIKPHPYDPEKATALLKEAGYPNGFDTTLPYGIVDKMEAQAVAADLARVGIRAKLVEMEMGTWIRGMMEKKLRGLGGYHTPYWGGIIHPGVSLENLLSAQLYWSYVVTPEADAAWKKLYGLTDEKAIAAQAKEVSRIYRESEIRYMLWALHWPIGLSPKVKSYKPIQGRQQICGLEFLELKD
jgi:peptide/nickel transport system substrate-binding protein